MKPRKKWNFFLRHHSWCAAKNNPQDMDKPVNCLCGRRVCRKDSAACAGAVKKAEKPQEKALFLTAADQRMTMTMYQLTAMFLCSVGAADHAKWTRTAAIKIEGF
jgi:hypothetical protein